MNSEELIYKVEEEIVVFISKKVVELWKKIG